MDHNTLWKILKEMGIPDHLTCLLRNLYAGQEATVRTGHGTTNWFQIGKGVHTHIYIHTHTNLFSHSPSMIIKMFEFAFKTYKLHLNLH